MRIEYRETVGDCVSELTIELDETPGPAAWGDIRRLIELCFPEPTESGLAALGGE